ncbi:Tat pathway signal protein [Arcobacter sp.]|uniref:Tat pathway signal protein n=1 Tax=Arcobacter sp. TaxID=1872629 RepID=UPI003C750FFB
MKDNRRSFIKKTLGASALVAAAGATAAIASTKANTGDSSHGVVVGKSNKKEILYKETAEWKAFYKASY